MKETIESAIPINTEAKVERETTKIDCFGEIDKQKYSEVLEETLKKIEDSLDRKIDKKEDGTIYYDAVLEAIQESQRYKHEESSSFDPEPRFVNDIHWGVAEKLKAEDDQLETFSAVGSDLEKDFGVTTVMEFKDKKNKTTRLNIRSMFIKKEAPDAKYNDLFVPRDLREYIEVRVPQDGLDHEETDDYKFSKEITSRTSDMIAKRFKRGAEEV